MLHRRDVSAQLLLRNGSRDHRADRIECRTKRQGRSHQRRILANDFLDTVDQASAGADVFG